MEALRGYVRIWRAPQRWLPTDIHWLVTSSQLRSSAMVLSVDGRLAFLDASRGWDAMTNGFAAPCRHQFSAVELQTVSPAAGRRSLHTCCSRCIVHRLG